MSDTEHERARDAYRRWIETEWEGQESLAVAYCLDALIEAGGGDYGETATLTESEKTLLLVCFTGLHPPRDALRGAARDFYERIGHGRLRPFLAELEQLGGDAPPFAPPRRAEAGGSAPSIGPQLRQTLARHGCSTFATDERGEDTVHLRLGDGTAIGHAVRNGGLWEAYALVRPQAMFGNEKVGAHRDLEDAIRTVLANFMC